MFNLQQCSKSLSNYKVNLIATVFNFFSASYNQKHSMPANNFFHMPNVDLAIRKNLVLFAVAFFLPVLMFAQQQQQHETVPTVIVDPQPLLAQALRLRDALSFLGSPLAPAEDKILANLQTLPLTQETVKRIQEIFDPYCIALININPEGRVKVDRGKAQATLTQGGWTTFLTKINNEAGVNAQLKAESANALLPVHPSSQQPHVKKEDSIGRGQSENRFLEIQMYRNKPLLPNLSGLNMEYQVVQIYSRDAGRREAELSFNIGQGSQDIGFRNSTNILFAIKPSIKINLNIKDEESLLVMASFFITDSIDRIPGKFSSFYPLPSRRVAAFDEYPDFFFQKQVYRKDGESLQLPPGRYQVIYTRGPEYIMQQKELVVPANVDSVSASFVLKRWINMAKLGWYSADHHVHGGGCSHYDSPEEGVPPAFMMRQALGEDLNVAAVLSWGPSWYHQKINFTGKDDARSGKKNIIRYDVEVSGFPSSHAGHIVLLRLKEDDYPGTTTIEQWPSWTLPILKWAKAQGGVVGYAHSGWGLEPVVPTNDLPNYILPKMDNIGANEYIVAVTQNAVDFYSLGDTPAKWELNMWYHTLNCGFRPRASGETDFPCITDERVGMSRSYFKANGTVNYDKYVTALKNGSSYVSEGGSHLMNFSVNGQEIGKNGSELKLNGKQVLKISANVAAYIPEGIMDSIRSKLINISYWNIEWSRIGRSRNVQVELIVNGRPVDTVMIAADGKISEVNFNYLIKKSAWVAIRIWGSSHSNPIFVIVDGKPIGEKKSAEWCRKAVDQCWKMKSEKMRPNDRVQAAIAYDEARKIYDSIIKDAE